MNIFVVVITIIIYKGNTSLILLEHVSRHYIIGQAGQANKKLGTTEQTWENTQTQKQSLWKYFVRFNVF